MSDEKPKPRVLVVDDEHVIADTLAIILNQAGFDARAAYDGTEAVELARSWHPDMMISDVIMPGMNGIEAAIHIRGFLTTCRILLFDGQAAVSDLLENARARGHGFELVAKPVHPQTLLHWCRVDGTHDVRSCTWCQEQRALSGRDFPHGNAGAGCWCSWCVGLSTPEELETRAARVQLKAAKEATKKVEPAGGVPPLPPTEYDERPGSADDSAASQAAKKAENTKPGIAVPTVEGEKRTIQDRIKEFKEFASAVPIVLGVLALLIAGGYVYIVGLRTAYLVGIPAVKAFLLGPDIPGGTYVPVRVSAASRHDYLPLLGPHRATLVAASTTPVSGLGQQESWALSDLNADDGLRYAVECWPNPWNHCEPLDAGKHYYARWVTADHKQLAIGEPGGVSNGKLDTSSVVIYTVKGTDRVSLKLNFDDLLDVKKKSVPNGRYALIRIKAASIDGPDRYSIVLQGAGIRGSEGHGESGNFATLNADDKLTAKCASHLWSLSDLMSPDSAYYARWLTKGGVLAIGKRTMLSDYVETSQVALCRVVGWEKAKEQSPATGAEQKTIGLLWDAQDLP